MDGFWFDHVSQYPTAEELLSVPSMGIIRSRADIIDLDNVSSEINNANIRRNAHRVVQQKKKSVSDVSALWLLLQTMGDANDPFRQEDDDKEEEEEADIDDADDSNAASRLAGGGGRCRAFVSHLCKDPAYRLENNKCDFAKIMAEFKKECEKPNSKLLEEMQKKGENATRASAQIHSAGFSRSHSAFGALHSRYYDQRIAEAPLALAPIVPAEAPLALAPIVPFELCTARQRDLQIITHTDQLPGQHTNSDRVALLRKLRAADVRHHANLEKEHLAELKVVLNKPSPSDNVGNIQKHALERQLTPFAEVAYDPWSRTVVPLGPLQHLRAHVSQRVADLNTGKGGVTIKHVTNTFESAHALKREPHLAPLDNVHVSFKATFCSTYGYGTCLCTGNGILYNLARVAFGNALVALAPAKTVMRRWLLRGWLVVEIQDIFLHVAMCYLRPRRPTFIRLRVCPDKWRDCTCVEPVLKDTGVPDVVLDVDFMKELSLAGPCDVRFYKFVTFDCTAYAQPWHPSARLTIEGLEHHTDMDSGVRRWWLGEAAERAAEAKRMDQKRQADARRAQKRASSSDADAQAAQPPAAPKAKPKTRAMQRPTGAPPAAEEQLVALADAEEQPQFEINAWHLLDNDPEDFDNVAAADLPEEAGNDDGNNDNDDCIFSDGDSNGSDMDNDEQQELEGQHVSCN
jgi:hypothetical protein